jgi:putative nucleotidyltransferase with HDIG domain
MTPQELVKDIGELVSMPGVAVRINEMVDDVQYSAVDIGKVISQDPGLTVRLLKIANSPLYGFSSQIDTVSRAVTVLGTKQIRDLVLATSAIKAFDGIPNDLMTMDDFWQHSIACGLAARELMGKQRAAQGESIFVAGLLHDIGQLVIFNKLPQQARQVLELEEDEMDEISLSQAEQQLLGFDHAQVGAELIRAWQLPQSLYECVAFHHQPAAADAFKFEAAIVHLANTLAVMVELDTSDVEEGEVPWLDPQVWEITGLDKAVIGPTIAVVKERLAEVCSLFSR